MKVFLFCALGMTRVIASGAESSDSQSPLPLEPVEVVAEQPPPDLPALPTTASVTRDRVADTVNFVDPEDAVKFLPSVFLRKRNFGDAQAVMATRVWGVSSSARSLIFVDGVPLSALIANNNSIGGPRWGLVAPEEIERIDLMHGPFSAAYAGNSMGAVLEITTRAPEGAETHLAQTEAWQHFQQYGTRSDLGTHQTSVSFGRRSRDVSVWLSANAQRSASQPLNYVTAAIFPAGTTGGFAAANKLGAPANVVGAGGLLHTEMLTTKLKLGVRLTPQLHAEYVFGFWQNRADSNVETYLRNPAGNLTFAGLSGFTSGRAEIVQRHSMHSVSIKTKTGGPWEFAASASRYRFDRDEQRSPSTVSNLAASEPGFGPEGRRAVLTGTGWSTIDLKASWRSDSREAGPTVTAGVHEDRYRLINPTYRTAEWTRGPDTDVATEGDGTTRTRAIWSQVAWPLSNRLTLTAGIRLEQWQASDGYNVNGPTAVRPPNVSASNASPKARLEWKAADDWVITASVGQAYRYATASELYQLVSTGPTFTSPNPHLKPDEVLASELAVRRTLRDGEARVSFFHDRIHDAIISQFLPLVPGSPTLYSYLANVDDIRARGIEIALDQHDVGRRGFDYSATVTWTDARILALSGQASATSPPGSAVGKKLPNIPDWRAAVTASFRMNDRWVFSAGGRYSGMMFTTLDNTDVNPNTYQGFSAWFVADLHIRCEISRRWSALAGVDNLFNRKYFLFHPFPQRTIVATVKCAF